MLFRLLPLPKDLGYPCNALLMRKFGAEPGAHTWEDWHVEVVQKFPWRWRLSKVVDWLRRWPRLSNALYWLRTHTKDRYHIVDLRQAEPENSNGYRWGWLDRDRALLLACFTVLRQFVEREEPWDPGPPRAEAAECEIAAIARQKATYDEVMALYSW